jgi:hypothetical protein
MSDLPPVAPMPATLYEQIIEMFRETDRKFQETDRKFQETDRKIQETARQMKETDKKIAALGNRLGELVEAMVEGGVPRLFQELGYDFTQCIRGLSFRDSSLGISGEIDLFLENGDCVLLVEVKTNLAVADVDDHIERLKKYRRCRDVKGDSRRILGAIGGGVVRDNVRDFALSKGMFVIIQSGDNVTVHKPEREPKAW